MGAASTQSPDRGEAPVRDGGLAPPLCPQQTGQLQGRGGHTSPSVSRAAGASPPREFLTITREPSRGIQGGLIKTPVGTPGLMSGCAGSSCSPWPPGSARQAAATMHFLGW